MSVAVQAKLKQDVLRQKAKTPERRCWPLRLRNQGHLPKSEAVACREFVVAEWCSGVVGGARVYRQISVGTYRDSISDTYNTAYYTV